MKFQRFVDIADFFGPSRYQDISLLGIFAPLSENTEERKFPLRTLFPGAKVPGNIRFPGTRERKFPGTFVPE